MRLEWNVIDTQRAKAYTETFFVSINSHVEGYKLVFWPCGDLSNELKINYPDRFETMIEAQEFADQILFGDEE